MAVLRSDSDGVLVACKVQPRSSRSMVCGLLGDQLKVAVSGAPVDGRANAELCVVLSDFFGVAKGRVKVKNGLTSRSKTVLISGIALEDAEKKVSEYR